MTAALTAAALRGIDSVRWPSSCADSGRPKVHLALHHRTEVAEAAAREVLAEVTAALVEDYSPRRRTDAPYVVMGYQNALHDIAVRLGIDLDAALSTPPAEGDRP